MIPRPTQIEGARFLANRRFALLADEPRVGKTGAAIMACDYCLDQSILVVTTASGRAVWRRAWRQWTPFPRTVQVMLDARPAKADVVIVGWAQIAEPKMRAELTGRRWDRLILDESHYAKDFSAKRTQAVYGTLWREGDVLQGSAPGTLAAVAAGVWPLTGTPLPNSPFDVYPMLRALWPERLKADDRHFGYRVAVETARFVNLAVAQWAFFTLF